MVAGVEVWGGGGGVTFSSTGQGCHSGVGGDGEAQQHNRRRCPGCWPTAPGQSGTLGTEAFSHICPQNCIPSLNSILKKRKKRQTISADVQIYVCNYNVSLKSPHCVVVFLNPSVNIYIVYFFATENQELHVSLWDVYIYCVYIGLSFFLLRQEPLT